METGRRSDFRQSDYQTEKGRFEERDLRFEVGDRGAYQTADFRMLDTQMQTIILKRDRFCLLVIYPHTYKQKLPIAKGSFLSIENPRLDRGFQKALAMSL